MFCGTFKTFCLAVAKVPQNLLTWLQDLNVCEHCVLADPCLLYGEGFFYPICNCKYLFNSNICVIGLQTDLRQRSLSHPWLDFDLNILLCFLPFQSVQLVDY